jgi:hypothetical protein
LSIGREPAGRTFQFQKNRGPWNEPQNSNCVFLENGCNSFISFPKLTETVRQMEWHGSYCHESGGTRPWAETRNMNVTVAGFTSQADFVFVRISPAVTDLPSNSRFSVEGNVVKGNHIWEIRCNKFASIFNLTWNKMKLAYSEPVLLLHAVMWVYILLILRPCNYFGCGLYSGK